MSKKKRTRQLTEHELLVWGCLMDAGRAVAQRKKDLREAEHALRRSRRLHKEAKAAWKKVVDEPPGS